MNKIPGFGIAKRIALKVTAHRQRHSVLILKSGNLIAYGNNDGRLHAEHDALKLRGFNFKGCTLISFRVKPSGAIGNSKPCITCEQLIKEARIRKVIYFDGKQWVEEVR